MAGAPFQVTTQFKKDLKKARRQGKNLDLLMEVVTLLQDMEVLDDRYRDHPLRGDYADCRECHLQPDWLLIYRYSELGLQLVRLGSHSELFG